MARGLMNGEAAGSTSPVATPTQLRIAFATKQTCSEQRGYAMNTRGKLDVICFYRFEGRGTAKSKRTTRGTLGALVGRHLVCSHGPGNYNCTKKSAGYHGKENNVETIPSHLVPSKNVPVEVKLVRVDGNPHAWHFGTRNEISFTFPSQKIGTSDHP